jgi:hypothetical protein
VWRNAPNISYEDIAGFEILLFNSAVNNHEEFAVRDYIDASATFYSLIWLNETLKMESTFVQVSVIKSKHNIKLFIMQIRALSSVSEHDGLFSQPKSLGTVVIVHSVLRVLLAIHIANVCGVLV